MSGRWYAGVQQLTLVGLLLFAVPASAQLASQAQPAPEQRSFALDYHAHVGCPDALSVVAAIQARSPQATSVPRESAAVQLRIELSTDGQSRLWVDLPEGSFRREFRAATCDEAVASMALIASMVLEAEPAQRSAMTEVASLAAPQGQAAAMPEPAAEAAEPETPPAPPPPPPPPLRPTPRSAPAEPPPPQSDPARVRWTVNAGAALETAVAPTAPWGAAAGLEGRLERASAWSPSVRVELMATLTASAQTPAGDATFRLLAGRLHGCPLRVALGKSLRLLPCALVEIGSLQAQGGGSALNLQAPSMLWLGFGGAARGELDLTKALALEATLNATALAEQARFVFLNSGLVYQVPNASFGAGFGFLLRLP